MKELTSCIKKNNSDVVELESFKKLATTLTGIEDVQGETIADVIGFINDNYSGGGSNGGNPFIEEEYTLLDTNNKEKPLTVFTLKRAGFKTVQIPVLGETFTINLKYSQAGAYYSLFSFGKYIRGVLPCTYSYTSEEDDTTMKKGVLEVSNGYAYLITDEVLLDGKSLWIEASGILEEMTMG